MKQRRSRARRVGMKLFFLGVAAAALTGAFKLRPRDLVDDPGVTSGRLVGPLNDRSHPRQTLTEASGLALQLGALAPWKPEASLAEVAKSWQGANDRAVANLDAEIAGGNTSALQRVGYTALKSVLFSAGGETEKASQALAELRSSVESEEKMARMMLSSIIYLQGVTGLRQGENDNCIMCRGESSCILPIAPGAVHTHQGGSRRAIRHFGEYLAGFPDDVEVRWLLNIAAMTVGDYPEKVDPRYRLDLTRFLRSEFDIGKFRDIGHLVGVNRLNQGGGAIMEDFDNDGRLDFVVTSIDATEPMAVYRNRGDDTVDDRSESAGVTAQLGGLVCYQTDFNNDGLMDIFVPRGAWWPVPVRPTLLRNDGQFRFTDVTREANLLDPVNSSAAAWADYDNDGWLDLFVACEQQPSRLYHNRGNGTFEEVAAKAGVQGSPDLKSKGCAWIDHDNDGDPDLFVNNLGGLAQFYRNNGDGTFSDVGESLGIDGPRSGFSCWAWDYDNDGWLDLFATSYDRSLGDVVKGILGEPHDRYSNRLFRNCAGARFEDVTDQAGLNLVFATMGSNFGDFDNDGWLDMYLATGEPGVGFLVPNRMFKNVNGSRFAEITGTSGTGHLQKGHGVACGDWDRDGDVDLFVQMGGAFNGDRYHNILFQNPGQGNHWLTVKLVGRKTNRAAIGARLEVVTAGESPREIHRHISSGSSFGANPLEQTVGLGDAKKVARLEVYWPTSRTTQVFEDVGGDQAIEITEFASDYRVLAGAGRPSPR